MRLHQVDGLRTLIQAIEKARLRGVPVRVLTTTYVGSTDRKALDALRELGAEIKVSYETGRTRLHAKAWLFHRDSGFSRPMWLFQHVAHGSE